MYLIKLIKSNQVIIIMLYVYMYVVYFVMYDSVLILLLSYGHHDWFNKVFLSLFLFFTKLAAFTNMDHRHSHLFHSKNILQGKHPPFSPSSLRLNIFRLFVILSLTQLYRYTPEIFLISTATFKYTYRAPLIRIGQE